MKIATGSGIGKAEMVRSHPERDAASARRGEGVVLLIRSTCRYSYDLYDMPEISIQEIEAPPTALCIVIMIRSACDVMIIR